MNTIKKIDIQATTQRQDLLIKAIKIKHLGRSTTTR